jgi:hypothetical protein
MLLLLVWRCFFSRRSCLCAQLLYMWCLIFIFKGFGSKCVCVCVCVCVFFLSSEMMKCTSTLQFCIFVGTAVVKSSGVKSRAYCSYGHLARTEQKVWKIMEDAKCGNIKSAFTVVERVLYAYEQQPLRSVSLYEISYHVFSWYLDIFITDISYFILCTYEEPHFPCA